MLGERISHCKVQGLSAVSCADTAEPMDLPFGCGLGQCAQFKLYSPGGANVRHLVNTIEPPSVKPLVYS